MSTPPGAARDLDLDLPVLVAPSSPVHLVLRLVAAALVLAAVVGAATAPAQRGVADLLEALARGEVATVMLERPAGPSGAEVAWTGSARVVWTGDGRDGTATYQVDPAAVPPVDEAADLVAAVRDSPRAVALTEVPGLPSRTPWPNVPVVLAGFVLALGLLLAGPAPRLVTRWGWFWLTLFAWPAWLAFLLLEPTLPWDRRVLVRQPFRLAGFGAFLLAVVLGPLLMSAVTASG